MPEKGIQEKQTRINMIRPAYLSTFRSCLAIAFDVHFNVYFLPVYEKYRFHAVKMPFKYFEYNEFELR